jgi:hypothetical protein
MIAFSTAPVRKENQNEKFEQMLTQIRTQASIAFRDEPHERREDLIAEVVANAFVAYDRLVKRGKADIAYATPLAQFAIKQIRSGRRVGNKLNVRDLSSEYARRSKGFTVERLDRYNQRNGEWKEIVVEDRHAGPAEVAACRIDYGDWLKLLTNKQRSIANLLAVGETTRAVATKVGITDGRVSQVRRELMAAWREFQGELAVA